MIGILEDTVAVLKGQSEHRPDLAEHLLNLGVRAMRGESREQFAGWLGRQTIAMRDGHTPGELVEWIKSVIKLLAITEQDITSWLQGVVDFRYPLAVYNGTVSYFDSQITSLVSSLKRLGIYDQSLIIVTAPHGEILDDSRLPYHHFLLTPDTLHVPLIMKLPLSSETKRGVRIGGTIDLIDLFPTIMDIEQLPLPGGLSGVSRWDEIRSGDGIPPHDSFATGLHQLSHSLCRPPYLMTRQRPGNSMTTFHSVLNGGATALYNTESGELVSENSALTEDLPRRLRDWQLQFTEA